MTNSLYISDDKRWTVDKLKRTSENVDGFFESNKDVYVFAASIGFNHELQRSLVDTKGGEIPLHIFSKENKDYIDTLAIASTLDSDDEDKGKVELLSWENETAVDEKLRIFQEYANGGLEIIYSKLFDDNNSIYDNLLQLIYSETGSVKKKTSTIGNLEGMIDEI